MEQLRRLVDIMARLRAPGGCPWDREQNHDSLKPYLLEEAYEVLEAIDRGNDDKLAEELGDLLLQIAFHAQMAAERGSFTMEDVARGINEKLHHRHPHVFADAIVRDSDEVVDNWEQIKRAEQGNADRASVLDGIPASLPALQKATKVQKRVAKVGFDWDDASGPAAKVREELAEVEEAASGGDADRTADEVGDLLFAVVNLARLLNTDSEDALRLAVERFSGRFRAMEDMAADRGIRLKGLTLEQLDELWETAKQELASARAEEG